MDSYPKVKMKKQNRKDGNGVKDQLVSALTTMVQRNVPLQEDCWPKPG